MFLCDSFHFLSWFSGTREKVAIIQKGKKDVCFSKYFMYLHFPPILVNGSLMSVMYMPVRTTDQNPHVISDLCAHVCCMVLPLLCERLPSSLLSFCKREPSSEKNKNCSEPDSSRDGAGPWCPPPRRSNPGTSRHHPPRCPPSPPRQACCSQAPFSFFF